MAFFVYTGRDVSGRRVRGHLEAEEMRQAVEVLRSQGIFITSLEPDRDVALHVRQRLRAGAARRRATAGELAAFCRQLNTLVEAGVPVVQALEACQEQAVSPALARAVEPVVAAVRAGSRLAEAFATPDFPPVVAQLVGAAEVGGFLDGALRRLAHHFERERDLAARVAAATLYPKIVGCAAAGLLLVFVFFVVPRFVDLFAQLGVDPPLVLRAAAALRQGVVAHPVVAALLVPGAAAAVLRSLREGRARRFMAAVAGRVPLVARLRTALELARVFRILGTLLDGGIPLLTALEVARQGVGQPRLAAALDEVRRSVERGEGVFAPLRERGLLAPLGAALLATGEETGSLPTMLLRLADLYEEEANEIVGRLASYLEPAIIVVVGVLVGLLLVSIFGPIFSVYGRF